MVPNQNGSYYYHVHFDNSNDYNDNDDIHFLLEYVLWRCVHVRRAPGRRSANVRGTYADGGWFAGDVGEAQRGASILLPNRLPVFNPSPRSHPTVPIHIITHTPIFHSLLPYFLSSFLPLCLSAPPFFLTPSAATQSRGAPAERRGSDGRRPW